MFIVGAWGKCCTGIIALLFVTGLYSEVNFLDVNSAGILEIKKFRLNRQFTEFPAHFLLPAWAGQLAHFCKSEIFYYNSNFRSNRQTFGTKKLTSGFVFLPALK